MHFLNIYLCSYSGNGEPRIEWFQSMEIDNLTNKCGNKGHKGYEKGEFTRVQ